MATAAHWDGMYNRPVQDIPWEIPEPPEDLLAFLRRYPEVNGSVLDAGCGTGNYSIYLARHGFKDVVGVDFSQQAINTARKRAHEANVEVEFLCGDITSLDMLLPGRQFDFILDYSILHHISDDRAQLYADQCMKALRPGGKLLLVCYTEYNEFAAGQTGTGKYGNDMYFRSADEIRQLYKPLREVSYAISTLGRRGQHEAHQFIFAKEGYMHVSRTRLLK